MRAIKRHPNKLRQQDYPHPVNVSVGRVRVKETHPLLVVPQIDAVQIVIGNDNVIAVPNRFGDKRHDIGVGHGVDLKTHKRNGVK